MKTKAMILTAALLVASLPLFAAYDAFMKIDSVPGESTSPAHTGWIDLTSFSWGVAPGSGGGVQGCAGHAFVITKRIDKASPRLTQMALTGNHIPNLTLDLGGQRHLLQDVMITSVPQQGSMGGGSPLEALKFTFVRCTTHETPGAPGILMGKVFPKVESNGLMSLGAAGGQGAISLQDLHFVGQNQAVIAVREAANGRLLPFVERAFQSKQRLPQLTLSAYQTGGSGRGEDHKTNYLTFTFHDVLISGISSGGDFKQITLNFAKFDGPMTGFHDIYLK
jgi:type VI secretion system secreted protein Hcp